jgi:hypothetical protein
MPGADPSNSSEFIPARRRQGISRKTSHSFTSPSGERTSSPATSPVRFAPVEELSRAGADERRDCCGPVEEFSRAGADERRVAALRLRNFRVLGQTNAGLLRFG